ncbi:Ig-like domain-containing protein [Desulfosporosinus meridiei]|uniref:Ig-like domain-containing surface protein n=1 Tax=Desulfosporosinus meridiei (strain ATCC BAA-275 / DSM 13257 / KCTC 12902 / NCIMB 13706 / S10) TaxID=768704 RepID=J7IV62_DESMD|nr:Ig-like domain-containing protein [Desulfosporosinus meridiei]AFQ45722.1 Ig-like domain-containing surface protein [Desulfosporosinus meridiei DSM 13257]
MIIHKRVMNFAIMLFFAIILLIAKPFDVLANGETVNTIPLFQQAVADNMNNRETEFTINYTGDADELINQLDEVVTKAEKSDDYLSLSWKEINHVITGEPGDTQFNFTIEYFTTKVQEDEVDVRVLQIASSITHSEMNDFQKEKAVHDWILANVNYDDELLQRTAYTALTSGKTVCQGYSMLMLKLLSAVGIENRIVTGYIGSEYHAWNLVKLDGKWYHVDSTNNDANADKTIYYNKTDNYMTNHGFTWDKVTFPQANTIAPNVVTGISFNEPTVAINVKASTSIKPVITPSNATNKKVTWQSADPAIAKVDVNGKIIGVKEGRTTITARTADGDFSGSFEVIVQTGVAKISLNKTTTTLSIGYSDELISTIAPLNAVNSNVTWKSSNSSIVTVDENGKIEALKSGRAVITVTSEDGNKKATCIVTVPTEVTGISLAKTSVTININDSIILKPVITPMNATNKKVNWQSSAPTVASVDLSGRVKGLSEGVATITATSIDGSRSATMEVIVQTGVTKIALNKTKTTLGVGSSVKLIATINPSNATNDNIIWKSSNSSIVTVDENGNIEALKAGSSVITATSENGKKMASCSVTVPTEVTGISFAKTTVTINIKGSTFLKPIINPSNATTKKINWKTSNPSVASVDVNGKILGVSEGEATITATSVDGNYSATFDVIVQTGAIKVELNKSQVKLSIGNNDQLLATINPTNATNANITWKSSNSAIVTVDENGNIEALKLGRAVITATTVDGGRRASCIVTVIN